MLPHTERPPREPFVELTPLVAISPDRCHCGKELDRLREVITPSDGYYVRRASLPNIQRMHFEFRETNEEARAIEAVLVFRVVPDDMADILAEEAFYTLAELLSALDVFLHHPVPTV